MRGKRPTLAAIMATGMVLAQLAGCGGCVKDDPAQSDPAATGGGRKPMDLRAADKKLSQFSAQDGSTDASHD
jgi:hypothetical protein